MEQIQEIEKRLWEYIDGICTMAEKALISRLLSEDPVWQNKYSELTSMHELLQKEDLDMPSLRFTKKVMEEIIQYQVAPATRNYINKNVIRGITFFFLALILGLFVYFIGQMNWTSQSSGNLFEGIHSEAVKINWNIILNNYYVIIFIGINVILGLILTDKFIQGKKNMNLKNYWSKGDSA